MTLLCIHTHCFTQNIKPLSIGDTVPDVVLNHILNYKTTSARLSGFKDKPVILDFFATWCSSCRAAIPALRKKQEQFGDSISIFLVDAKNTGDTRQKIADMMKRQPALKMPVLTEDTLLYKYFPHRFIPHYVWIQGNVVRAITSSEALTTENIRALIQKQTIALPVKNDFPPVNTRRSLFTDTAVLDAVIEHSILTKGIDGIGISSGLETDNKGLVTRLYCINFNLRDLYATAFPILKSYPNNRIIDSSLPTPEKNLYCYELRMPPASDSFYRKRMQEDLSNAFHLSVQEQNVPVRCLVIARQREYKQLFDTSGTSGSTLYGAYPDRYIHRQPLSLLVKALNAALPIPVLNETGINAPVSMDGLPQNLRDTAALKTVLARYGLVLSCATRVLKVCSLQPAVEATTPALSDHQKTLP